jgi:hypothetical protein
MAEGLRLLTLEKGLKPGVEYSAGLFSAGIMQAVTARVAIKDKKEVDLLGRVVKLTETTTTLSLPGAGQITTTSYVDDEMRTLKSTMPIAGMTGRDGRLHRRSSPWASSTRAGDDRPDVRQEPRADRTSNRSPRSPTR